MSGATYPLPGLEAPAEIRVDRWGLAHIRAGTTLDAFRVAGLQRGPGPAVAARPLAQARPRPAGGGFRARLPRPGPRRPAVPLPRRHGGGMGRLRAAGHEGASSTAFVDGLNAFVALTEARPDAAAAGIRPDATRARPAGSRRTWCASAATRWCATSSPRSPAPGCWPARNPATAGLAADDLRKRISPPHDPVVPDGLDAADWPDDLLDEFRLATAAVGFTPERMAAARDDAWAWSKVDAHGAVTRGRRAAPREPAEGSNNWVVGPSRTATGRPILASDPHRVYLQPSLRYAVHLTAPGLDVIGAGEPALPGISIGHNGHAAFSLTIAPMDQEDLFVCDDRPGRPGPLPIRRRLGADRPHRGDDPGARRPGRDRGARLHPPRTGDPRGGAAAPSRCGPSGPSRVLPPISAASPISAPPTRRASARPCATGRHPR